MPTIEDPRRLPGDPYELFRAQLPFGTEVIAGQEIIGVVVFITWPNPDSVDGALGYPPPELP